MTTEAPIPGKAGANIEEDYRPTVSVDAPSWFLPGTSIEIIRDVAPGVPIRHVVFDFDGTLSLVREGWPEVMVPMMVEILLATGTPETPDALYRHCHDFVMRLNGKQTIYQMIQLAEEVRTRGGTPAEPRVYKEEYHSRLMTRINNRRESLRSGKVDPADYLVPGTYGMLASLRDRGLRMYLASGTDERYVVEEAELLGLVPYFGKQIYGAVDDFRSFSKKMVIDRILRENDVEGSSLLGFGDGYVEIENVKSAGGVAVAVASDEAGRSGKPDAWKRNRLVGVGADLVVPDFRETDALLGYLFRGN
jgi:phosphoglycolate phosphatase